MRRVTWRAHGLTLSLCVPLLVVPAAAPIDARADVYKWVDENGVTYYTMERDEVRPELRRRLRSATAGPIERSPILPQREAFGPEGAIAPPEPVAIEAPEPTEVLLSPDPIEPPLDLTPERPELATRETAALETAPGPPEVPAPVAAPVAPSPEPELPDDAYPQLAQISKRVLELEEAIQRDRETLRKLISEGSSQGLELARDPRVREIAERLPRLQDELTELQRGKAR